MTCAGRGVSLKQRTHRPVMFSKVFLLLGTSFATVEDAAHRTDACNCAQRHRPVAFAATEGLRLVLCFAFNCGIRNNLNRDTKAFVLGKIRRTRKSSKK